jgi:hypothetical protein
MASKEYGPETWTQIRREWIAGQLSVPEISRNYGPSRQGIRKHAIVNNWPARGTLADEVRREINNALITGQEPGQVTAEVTPLETGEIIEGAARRGLARVRAHRGLLERTLGHAAVTLSEIDEMDRIKLELILKARLKHRSKLVTAIIANRIDALESVSRVLARVIPLDRQAFSLDTEKGEVQSITYVVPDMKKPPGTGLSEDTWVEEETE